RPLLHLTLQVHPDDPDHPLEQAGRHVDQRRVPAVLGKHVRDAVPHRPRPHHGHPAHDAVSRTRRGARARHATRAALPASITSVLTTPPSGPNAPPSIHACAPGRYANAGSGNAYPLTGAANPKARVAFQPKCAPHPSGMPPGEKNAHASHTPASATLSVENAVAPGLPRWASPNPSAPRAVAGPAPTAL